MRLVLLVPNLNRGGTERQVVLLSLLLRQQGQDVSVAVFRGAGFFADQLTNAGVRVIDLHGYGLTGPLRVLVNLARLLRRERVEVLYSFLPPANVVASFAAVFAPGCRVFWSIRSAAMPLSGYSLRTRLSYAIERRLARWPRAIIVNSKAGFEYCKRQGFAASKLITVANGFDHSVFRPDTAARSRLRAEFGLRDGEIAIGIAARMDPVKDHITFLRAAALLSSRVENLRFVCLGGAGAPAFLEKLHVLARSLGVMHRMIWAGERADMPAALNALDIATLCSVSEGFPNAVGEAMATGIPCVVTDVGDAGELVGETGFIVPVSNPAALALAWERLLDPQARKARGASARRRIVEHFSLQRLAERTLAVFAAGT